MKPRTVFVTLELYTSLPLASLRRPARWGTSCSQVQVNVARPKKKTKK